MLALCRLEALADGAENVAVTVGIGDLLAFSIHHGGGVPGVVVIACAVGREGTPGCGKFRPNGLLHHVKLRANAPAHGVAVADGLQGTELAQTRVSGREQPHTGGTGHSDDGGLAGEDVELTGAGMNARCADAFCADPPAFGQKTGDHDAIYHLYAQTAQLLGHSRLEGGAPDADSELILIVVGEHELGLLIPELGALELILGIPDLAAHLLDFLQVIPTLAALNVVRNTIVISVVVVQHGLDQILRADAGAGVGGGALPVVTAGAAGTGALCGTLFHQNDALTALGCGNGGHTAGDAAAQDNHVRLHPCDIIDTGRVRPFLNALHIASSTLHI